MSKYKVGDKVILTVSGLNDKVYYPYYEFNNNKSNLWQLNVDEYAEPLTAYTEPLEDKINRQATEIKRLIEENEKLKKDLEYYHTGTDICDMESARITGQNEAWELAKKIVLYDKDSYSGEELKEIFGYAYSQTIMKNYTYQEVAAKVAEWEKAKEEIKVGDVCMSNTGNCFAIRTIDHEKGNVEILWKDLSSGIVTLDFIKSHCTNTDRRIDIDSISQQISGEKK